MVGRCFKYPWYLAGRENSYDVKFAGACSFCNNVCNGNKRWGHFAFPAPSLKGISFSSLGMALYTVMWNFFGWDNTTTYAEEVDKPAATYLKSISIAFVTVAIGLRNGIIFHFAL